MDQNTPSLLKLRNDLELIATTYYQNDVLVVENPLKIVSKVVEGVVQTYFEVWIVNSKDQTFFLNEECVDVITEPLDSLSQQYKEAVDGLHVKQNTPTAPPQSGHTIN